MNKLPPAKRTQILAMLCEGSSMRSIERVAGVSINTASKLLVEAGEACLSIHDETVRGLKTLRISPAMAAGVTDRLWSLEDIVAKIDAMAPAPAKRGPYKKREKAA